MKFQKTLDIWTLSDEQITALQPGQWVSAGPLDSDRRNLGTFCGIKPSGSVVVAWRGNQKTYPNGQAAYRRALMNYARSN